MRLFLKLFIGVIVLTAVALTLRTDETYLPSIAALGPNETLVMKYSACHYGCDKETVRFQNKTAIMKRQTLALTPEEVRDLDLYFYAAYALEPRYFCSVQIKIGFKRKQAFRLPVKQNPKLHPCRFFDEDDRITPETLIYHFNETPDEIPFWRRPPEDWIVIIED